MKKVLKKKTAPVKTGKKKSKKLWFISFGLGAIALGLFSTKYINSQQINQQSSVLGVAAPSSNRITNLSFVDHSCSGFKRNVWLSWDAEGSLPQLQAGVYVSTNSSGNWFSATYNTSESSKSHLIKLHVQGTSNATLNAYVGPKINNKLQLYDSLTVHKSISFKPCPASVAVTL